MQENIQILAQMLPNSQKVTLLNWNFWLAGCITVTARSAGLPTSVGQMETRGGLKGLVVCR
jgi:hypothetical protein